MSNNVEQINPFCRLKFICLKVYSLIVLNKPKVIEFKLSAHSFKGNK